MPRRPEPTDYWQAGDTLAPQPDTAMDIQKQSVAPQPDTASRELREAAEAIADYWHETDVAVRGDAWVLWSRDEMDRRMGTLRAALAATEGE